MTAPHGPILRWHGGKWLLAPWIISHMPTHRVYVEPFGGAASVLLRKPRSYAEIYNDLDDALVNLFEILRDGRGVELAQLVELTPFARREFADAVTLPGDGLEKARQMIVRSFMGFGSNSTHKSSGFRANSNRSGSTPAHDWRKLPKRIVDVADRMTGVVIEHRPAIDVMHAHDGPETLHYVDPPYIPETRGRGKDYRHELTNDDHNALLTALCDLKGKVILSGYPSVTYDQHLGHWRRVERKALADGARARTEVLWMNFDAPAGTSQINLFEGSHA